MSIIEEALQRKAEEKGRTKGQQEEGLGTPPPVIPPKGPRREEKRGPLFWIIVLMLIVAVGLVSGIASYLYIFGGSLSDLAYMLPVSQNEERTVAPEAFNRSAKERRGVESPRPQTDFASKEKPIQKAEVKENATNTTNATQAAEELKSPWRVLKSQENATQKATRPEIAAEGHENKEKAEGKEEHPSAEEEAKEGLVSHQQVKTEQTLQPQTKLKSQAQVKGETAKTETPSKKPTKPAREKKQRASPLMAKKTTSTKPESIPQRAGEVPSRPKPHSEAKAPAPQKPATEEKLKPSLLEEKKPQPPQNSRLEVSARKAPEHPYYQEETVEEIPGGQGQMEFNQAPKPNPKEVVKKYLRLAIDFQEKGEETHAIELYKKVLEKDPNCVEALNNMASIYLKKGMIWRAEPLINKAFAFAPHKAEVVTNKAFIEFKRGHYFLAEGLWNQALNLNPSYVPAMVGLGTLYLAEGCPTDAQRVLSQALELEPNNPKVIYNLALAMDRSERYEEAIALYKELLKYYKSITPQLINKVAKRLYELEKSREGTGIKAMKREKGTW